MSEPEKDFIISASGQPLAVYFAGDPSRETVILVHGYPDNHHVWKTVVTDLARDFHVVTYDVRGAGESPEPPDTGDYSLPYLALDLQAVMDTVSPNQPVHLVAHDWGSIQSWEAVTDPALQTRIASFTSISGPCLDHMGIWLRNRLTRPSLEGWRQLMMQALRSWYIFLFHLPGAGALWRLGLGRLWPALLKLFESTDAVRTSTQSGDGYHGVRLYRANMLRRLLFPRERYTRVPVQLILPSQDKFVGPDIFSELSQWVPALWVRRIDAGHWLPLQSPQWLAQTIRDFVTHLKNPEAPHPHARFRCRQVGPESGRLVVVTGAGSGIGRATTLAYAEQGATVVAADISAEAAERTARLGNLGGGKVVPYVVDVSDADAMSHFASWVQQRLGVADIVINNAGIGMAGGIFATGVNDWARILGVNVWGIIHGARLFAAQMKDAGQPGHIVNVASAAAFSPSRTFPAYATTKAAALMLSECMRAELAEHRIGVTTICPGFVDTGIATATQYVGVSAEEQARRRDKAARLYRWRGFGAERVARALQKGVSNNSAVVLVGVEAWGAHWLSRLSPGLRRLFARVDFSPG